MFSIGPSDGYPPPRDFNFEGVARLTLDNGILVVTPEGDHASAESLQRAVEPLLKAWEAEDWLQSGIQRFAFKFDPNGSRIKDKNPPSPGPGDAVVTVTALVGVGALPKAKAVVTPGFAEYPDPPRGLMFSDELEKLRQQFARIALNDDKGLISEANVILTFLEASVDRVSRKNARDNAAMVYRLELKILSTLGRLCATRGGIEGARKFKRGEDSAELTREESHWIQMAIRAVIRRKAQYDYDPL